MMVYINNNRTKQTCTKLVTTFPCYSMNYSLFRSFMIVVLVAATFCSSRCIGLSLLQRVDHHPHRQQRRSRIMSQQNRVSFISYPRRTQFFSQQITSVTLLFSTTGSTSSSRNENTDATSSTVSASWNGEVVSNANNGRMRGCTILAASGGTVIRNDTDALDQILSNKEIDVSSTEWVIQIDGVEADLGRFSMAIYKKFISDAKQQQYQGYRAGTVPPPLLSTYRAYAMDECARETILEAMEQNQIRPFENCRTEMILYDFIVPPSSTTTSKSKKNGSKAKKNKAKNISSDTTAPSMTTTTNATNATDMAATNTNSLLPPTAPVAVVVVTVYATMKEAIDIGLWQPGQSFSFCAKHVRGQKSSASTTQPQYGTPTPLGIDY